MASALSYFAGVCRLRLDVHVPQLLRLALVLSRRQQASDKAAVDQMSMHSSTVHHQLVDTGSFLLVYSSLSAVLVHELWLLLLYCYSCFSVVILEVSEHSFWVIH